MDLAKIVRLVAVLFAVVAGLAAIPQEALILAVLGLVAGWFTEEDHVLPFLVATVALSVSAGALSSIPAIGDYITNILNALLAAMTAGAITVIVKRIVDRVKP